MVGRVALALVAACMADHDACLDRRAYNAEVGLGLAGHDSANRVADIRAVEIEPDAPNQLQHVRLAEAGVGAAGAGGGAVEALLDTAKEQVAVETDRTRMPLDDFSNRHVAPPCRDHAAEFRQRHWVGVVSGGIDDSTGRTAS